MSIDRINLRLHIIGGSENQVDREILTVLQVYSKKQLIKDDPYEYEASIEIRRLLKVSANEVFVEDIREERLRLTTEWGNFKFTKHTEMLGLIGNWEQLKLLREQMAEARMSRSWRE